MFGKVDMLETYQKVYPMVSLGYPVKTHFRLKPLYISVTSPNFKK